MARLPSDKTQLAASRREANELQRQLNTVRIECASYRSRATKAEQEVSEWKTRFDKLLEFRKGLGLGE